MKIIQTLATDTWVNLSERNITNRLLWHFISATTIRKTYGIDQEMILISDTKGKQIIEELGCFPYDTITNDLDNFPYTRPHIPVGYKLYCFELYPNDDVVHIDNDVLIKNQLPSFTDTIVQSNDGDWIMYDIDEDWFFGNLDLWTFPPSIVSDGRVNLTNSYNPGVLGFKSNSTIKEQYVSDYYEYLQINTNMLNQLKIDDLETYNTISDKHKQGVNTILEEGYLYHLCETNGVNVVEVLDSNIVPSVPQFLPNGNAELERKKIHQRYFNHYVELGYIHFSMASKGNKSWLYDTIGNLDTDSNTTFIPYISDEIKQFLNTRVGLPKNPINQFVNILIKDIIEKY
jgi:hypothetical protein